MDIQFSPGTALTFALYTILVLGILSKKLSVLTGKGLLLLTGILSSATLFNLVAPGIWILVIIYIGTAHLTRHQNPFVRIISWALIVVISLALAMHIVPGFHNEIVFQTAGLGTSTLPYTLKAGLDKAIAAATILSLMIDRLRFPGIRDFLKNDIPIIAIGIATILTAGYSMGLDTDFKLGQLTLAFAFFNLFVTCLAEEAFFRLLLQDSLWRAIKHKSAGLIAFGVSATLFTLAHFHTGPGAIERMFLIFLAALLYAGVYWRSRSYLSAVAAHFFLNFLHLTFFTYPASF